DTLINKTSLSRTVDAINAALFDGRALATTERTQVARWIGRQGLPGRIGEPSQGSPSSASSEIVLFTGERIGSPSARHVLGGEASRVLRLLRVRLRRGGGETSRSGEPHNAYSQRHRRDRVESMENADVSLEAIQGPSGWDVPRAPPQIR